VETAEYARIAAAEDAHWWYRNTRAVMADLLTPWLRPGLRVLDAGCGPGGNGAWLATYGTVVGADLSDEALRFVRQRHPGTAPVRASVNRLPFADQSFDIVADVTVVYSVPDDVGAVHELARVLKPAGALLLFEPALRVLRREHDNTVHGVHRYRRGELADMARDAGLQVVRATYLNSFLVPPAAALALAERLRPRATAESGSDVERDAMSGVFARLARAERAVLRRTDVPIGSSAVVLATRR